MNTDKATPELFAALALAQAEVENANKNAANPHFRSKYADLAEVLNTVRPVFAKHGLSLLQSPEFDGAMVSVVTLVAHKTGGYVTAQASCVPAKSDAQGVGSATTYLRRYAASAMAGIAQEDDDGQSAAHNQPPALKVTPTDGAWEAMGADEQAGLLRIAAQVIQRLGHDPADAWDYLHTQQLRSEEKIALWTRFDSKQRSALKRAEAATKEKAA
jgi:hypothetical protein